MAAVVADALGFQVHYKVTCIASSEVSGCACTAMYHQLLSACVPACSPSVASTALLEAVQQGEQPVSPLGSFPAIFAQSMALGLLSRRRVHQLAQQHLSSLQRPGLDLQGRQAADCGPACRRSPRWQQRRPRTCTGTWQPLTASGRAVLQGPGVQAAALCNLLHVQGADELLACKATAASSVLGMGSELGQSAVKSEALSGAMLCTRLCCATFLRASLAQQQASLLAILSTST